MDESIPITKLNIYEETKQSLYRLGYTETGNFINKDDIILAKKLSKRQYIDLAIAMAEIKANLTWELYNEAV